jgi:hypothetical protein
MAVARIHKFEHQEEKTELNGWILSLFNGRGNLCDFVQIVVSKPRLIYDSITWTYQSTRSSDFWRNEIPHGMTNEGGTHPFKGELSNKRCGRVEVDFLPLSTIFTQPILPNPQ